jgi:hypothetical protein
MPNPTTSITGQVQVITYSCPKTKTKTATTNCDPSEPKKHMNPGDAVVMIAIGTDVKIKFRNNKSPFVSGVKSFQIRRNHARVEIVKRPRRPSDVFLYKLSCHCGGGPSTDPSMMVP